MRTKLRSKFTLLFLTLGMLLAISAVAFGAELLAQAELNTATPATRTVTVEKGKSATFDIDLSASGNLSCLVTSTNPATAKVKNSYTITKSGTGAVVNAGATFSDAKNFYSNATECAAKPDNPSPVDWSGRPTPQQVTATVDAASDVPTGTYNISLSPSNGTTQVTNPISGSGSQVLQDSNATTLSFQVVPPSDTTKPTLNLPADITKEATGSNGAAVTYTATADDANPVHPTVTCSPASGSTFAIATTTVNCEATDAAGNKATGSFKVTVQDTIGPNITNVPNNITEEATSAAGATVTFTKPTATDTVDGARTVSCSPDSGSTFSLGTTEVTCSASDTRGNTSSAKFNVTVEDTTAPNIANHADITGVEATGPDGATVNYTKPNATDAVDGNVEVSCAPASGTKFALGETTVNCTATDNAGNDASSSFKVTVVDTTGPVLTLPGDITKEATGPNGAQVSFTASANDAVTGSQPVTCSPASGATFPLGLTTVNCSANDGSGNSSTESFKVTVQDTTKPVIATHLDVTATATSSAGATVTYSLPATSDAVDGAKTATCTPASGTPFAVGSTTVTCNATDAAGNHATPTTFKVNVSFGWSNFLQPINVPPATQSVFKLGSTVPVKFNLTGASAGITDGTFYLKYIRTGNGDGLGELETVATTTGTTGTQFRYDATAGQYIYNWSTKSVGQAGNYELRVYSDAAGTKLLGSVTIELKK